MSKDLHKMIFDLVEVDGRGPGGRGGVSVLLSVSRDQARPNDLIICIRNHLRRSKGQIKYNIHVHVACERLEEHENKVVYRS
jgi:hypothetical protein